MPRSGPITMTFPPFAGTVRRLILANLVVFFGMYLLSWISPPVYAQFFQHLLLEPAAVVRGDQVMVIVPRRRAADGGDCCLKKDAK